METKGVTAIVFENLLTIVTMVSTMVIAAVVSYSDWPEKSPI
jgi:hypothetical protein